MSFLTTVKNYGVWGTDTNSVLHLQTYSAEHEVCKILIPCFLPKNVNALAIKKDLQKQLDTYVDMFTTSSPPLIA